MDDGDGGFADLVNRLLSCALEMRRQAMPVVAFIWGLR